MGCEHVIQHENIAQLPGETNLCLLVSFTNSGHRRLLYWRPITVEAISRQILLREQSKQRSSYFFIQTGRMPVGGLIPPDPVPCLGMFEHCGADQPRP